MDIPLNQNYTFAWGMQEYVGGPLKLFNTTHEIILNGGNPPLYLPQSIINKYNTTLKTIQLPDRQYFQDVQPTAYDPYGQQFYLGAGIVSTVNFADPKCDTTTSGYMNLIGVFSNGDQYYYDPRIVLEQNTVEQPIPDGGGTTGTLCSNVAKNFLNRTFIFSDYILVLSMESLLKPFHPNHV